jgi:hypothetical protein
LLSRRLEQAENSKTKLEQTASEQEESYTQQLDRHKQTYEATIEQLNAKNAELEAKLQ